VQKSAGKFLASIFWDKGVILLIDYVPNGHTIKAGYYSSLLVQIKDILKGKRRGNVTKCFCSCTTIAIAHATPKKLVYLDFQ
jgi:hypothetical protein